VRPYPGPGAPIRVSPGGGVEPVWARNGRELFYIEPTTARMMVLSVTIARSEPSFSQPAALFDMRDFLPSPQPPSYDVGPDGRLLMLRAAGGDQPGRRPITVVLNWPQTLPPTRGRR
jgi:hypothetical protein